MTDRQRRALAMALPKRLPVREAREMTAAAPSPDYALSGAA
jgi:hypothetical protein